MYHLKKLKTRLIFRKYDIDSAVRDLKKAFENNFFKDPLSNEEFFNIKKCKKLILNDLVNFSLY